MVDAKQRDAFKCSYDLIKQRQITTTEQPAAHQSEAIQKLVEWYNNSYRPESGGIVAIPTGGGKTFVALRFLCGYPLSEGYKVLWLAETHHLLEQAYFSFAKNAPRINEPRQFLTTRVVSGAKQHFPVAQIEPSDDIVFATIRTVSLAHKKQHPKLESFMDSAQGKLFVVFDEAHHAPAPSYRNLIHAIKSRCKKMHLLGLTATPVYGDEKKETWLKKIFPQGILYQVSPGDLMARGILSKPVSEEPKTNIVPEFDDREYRNWLATNRDLPENIVTALAENRERNEIIASTYASNKHKYGKTIIFADRWFQCDQIREFLRNRGVRADVVYSHIDARPASEEERKKRKKNENAIVLDKFKDGDLDVLINVRMLTEGTDVPDVQSVFLTRQTTSKILMTQMVGRALRGPVFGGTEEAYIVSFIDDWQQLVNWATYELPEGPTVQEPQTDPKPRPPTAMISIELVRNLARQMDTRVNMASGPFKSLLPVGWYKTEYQAVIEGTEDLEETSRLVLVFDDEVENYNLFIRHIEQRNNNYNLIRFENEDIRFSDVSDELHKWSQDFFSEHFEKRFGTDRLNDLFSIVRHIGQHNTLPKFFLFEQRDDHDLDRLAYSILEKRMDPFEIDQTLRQEYQDKNRYWNTIYYKYGQFKSQFDGCLNRILHLKRIGTNPPLGSEKKEEVERPELNEETKKRIKNRDGYKCLCCGNEDRRSLQVDHIRATYFSEDNSEENLQTLCKYCNGFKETREIDFRVSRTCLSAPPNPFPKLLNFSGLRGQASGTMILRRILNFFYECRAVDDIEVRVCGHIRNQWIVNLSPGNDPAWIRPYQSIITESIRKSMIEAGLSAPDKIIISSRSSGDQTKPLRPLNLQFSCSICGRDPGHNLINGRRYCNECLPRQNSTKHNPFQTSQISGVFGSKQKVDHTISSYVCSVCGKDPGHILVNKKRYCNECHPKKFSMPLWKRKFTKIS